MSLYPSAVARIVPLGRSGLTTLGILLGLLYMMMTHVAVARAENNPNSRVIRHSDVVFMYDNPDLYEAYGCTVLGWAGARSPERIALAHQRGVRLFAVSVGFRTEFARMIDFTPDFLQAACRNYAGDTFIVPWLWDHKHKGQPAWWFCTNHPLYRQYLMKRLEETVASGADALHIDDYTGTASAVTWLDACFCSACMAGFRTYLKTKLSAERQKELGITDLDTFDYRQFLMNRGITPERYRKERPGLPLATEFLDFQVQAATDFVAEYRRKGEELKGGPLPLAVNSGLTSPLSLAITPHVSYFCCEVHHAAESRKVPFHPIYVYKLADGLNRPVTSTASGGDWAYIMENNLPGLVRTWVALSYAFGHNLMAPHRQWCYTQKKGTHWYSGPTEEYAPLYRFVREHASILDDFEAVGRIAVLYDNHSRRLGKGDIERITMSLADANWPFKVLVQGNDWLPGYRVDPTTLGQFDKVIVPEDLQPLPEIQAMLDQARSQGKLVTWSAGDNLALLGKNPVQVSSPGAVFIVPRVKTTGEHPVMAIHLVNRQYDGEKDKMIPLTNLTLTIDETVLPGRADGCRSAKLHSPGKEDMTVVVKPEAKHLTVTIPEIDLWTIVELEWR
ncbi:MAG: hypothetical protein WBH86_07670 [Thermogutta sp.]|nr:hypothetical protein [Thermogutta sp.]HOP78518.1 hypothetical protein [Thermogutta sp.]HPU07486.1 hypothetical protein [Thermogutta sp.]HQF15294.1 hypothetical protein [Thermogutta sp.]